MHSAFLQAEEHSLARWLTIAALVALSSGFSDVVMAAETAVSRCETMIREQPRARDGYHCLFQAAVMGDEKQPALARLEQLGGAIDAVPWARLYLGRALSEKKEPRGLDLFREAINAFDNEGDLEGRVLGRARLAYYLARVDRYQQASDELNLAEPIARDANRNDLLAELLVQRGLNAMETADFTTADLALRRAEGLVPSDDPIRTLPRVLHGLGLLALRRGRYEEALPFLTREADYARRTNTLVNLANAHHGLLRAGAELESRGRLERVELRRMAETTVAEIVPRSHAAALAHFVLGELSEGDEAVTQYLAALSAYDDSPRRPPQGILMGCGLGLLRVAPQRRAESWRLIEEAKATALSAQEDAYVGDILGGYAQAWWISGDRDQAIRASLTALDRIESTHAKVNDSGLRTGVFAFQARPFHLLAGKLLEGAEATPSRSELELAFLTLERMRARALLDHLNAAASMPGASGSDSMSPELSSLTGAIARVQQRLVESALPEAQRAAELARLSALELQEDELLAKTSGNRPAVQPSFPSLAQVQDSLDADEAMLAYSISQRGEGGSWVIRISRDGVAVAALPEVRELAGKIERFVNLVERQDQSELVGAALLGQSLLNPQPGFIPQNIRRLIVLPDGVLWKLPFDALVLGPQHERVAQRFELSVSPAASLWLRWRHTPPPQSELSALVFADPRLPASAAEPADERSWMVAQGVRLGRLPFADAEGKQIARDLDGVLLRGGDATESRLKQESLQRYAILHFATHALVDDTEPRRSAVLLSPGDSDQDGLLQPREIAALSLNGRVVILSACRGGAGVVIEGEGPLSLARSFFAGGARTVIAGLQPLRDDRTARLTTTLGERLANGSSIGAALAAAKREAIASGVPAAGWSTLVLMGDGSVVPMAGIPPRVSRTPLWMGAALLFVALAAFGLRFGLAARRRSSGSW